MIKPEWKERKCDVCGKMFSKKSWYDRHEHHEPDCDRKRLLNGTWVGHCVCDLVSHEECCPICKLP
jgi:hypothetical protein